MKIGVSSCLVGELCRYNGQGSNYDFLTKTLQHYARIVPYCPEAEVFGTPREAIRLVNIDNNIRVMTVNTKKDLTTPLEDICIKYAKDIALKQLSGFILKSKSPSCGMERVKLYEEDSYLCEKKEMGVFARAIRAYNPYLPLEEEGRLEDSWLRENFVMQIFAYEHIHSFMDTNPSMADLVEFHTTYKYLIFAKSQKSYKALGQIVANQYRDNLEDILMQYKEEFLKAIAQKSSIKKSYNVLLHIFGYFKNDLDSTEKQELLDAFDEFKSEIVPLIVPIKLLQLYIHKFHKEYLAKQKFLNPYPSELKLRSTIEIGK